MAKGTKTESTEIQLSDPVEVTGSQAVALLAAWRGVHEFFHGRANWEITNDGIVAHNFTVNSKYNPSDILRDISMRNRRLEFFPAYLYVQGQAPEPFTDPQDMTNFMVQYLKGSVEEGTSKTPVYVRDAVAEYKADQGIKTRRGPRRKVIRLDNLDTLSEVLGNIEPDDIDRIISLANQVKENRANAASETTEAITA